VTATDRTAPATLSDLAQAAVTAGPIAVADRATLAARTGLPVLNAVEACRIALRLGKIRLAKQNGTFCYTV